MAVTACARLVAQVVAALRACARFIAWGVAVLMASARFVARGFAVLLVCGAAAVPAAATAPPFDVAYRAWDAVTDLARHNRDPAIAGECGRTFRPFVIPGLRMQAKQEQEVAAAACFEAARSACANRKLQRTADIARKCEEFR